MGKKEISTQKVSDYMAKRISGLHPAYFALVMATGIVSIACKTFGLLVLADILFVFNIAAYGILWSLYIVRFIWFRTQFIADCVSHKRGFGFFTSVAATNVLGTQFLLFEKNLQGAMALWWIGLVLWAICTYSIFR